MPAQAVEYFQESVRRYRQMQFTGELGWALGGLALALEADGQPEAAQDALLEALDIADQNPQHVHHAHLPASHGRFCSPAAAICEAALRVHRLALRQPMQQNSRWYA